MVDRFNSNDPFSVFSSYPDPDLTRVSTGTGSSASTGKVPLVLDPAEDRPVVFSLTKDAGSTSSWNDYQVLWACSNNGVPLSASEMTVSADGLSVEVGAQFSDGVVCLAAVDANPALVSGFSVKKSADPVSNTSVARGDEVTYSVVAENTGQTVLENVTVTDDLAVGANVVLTYKVKVKTDAAYGSTLLNKVVAGGNDPSGKEVPSNCAQGVEAECMTMHRLAEPGSLAVTGAATSPLFSAGPILIFLAALLFLSKRREVLSSR